MLPASIPWLLIVPAASNPQTTVAEFLTTELGWPHGSDHPDLHWLNPDEKPLTIDQVRRLQTEVTYQPYAEVVQFFVIHHLNLSSVPAQNALLKTLEEPPVTTQIIITVTQLDGLLSTIQSRCRLKVVLPTTTSSETNQTESAAHELFQQLATARPSRVIELTEGMTDKQTALNLLHDLIRLTNQTLETQPTPHTHHQLTVLMRAVTYLQHNTNVRLTMEVCFLQLLPPNRN